MYLKKNYYIILSLAITLAGCTTSKLNQSSNDRLYKKENNELNAKYVVYHINDSISEFFYTISNEALIYKKTDTSNFFYSDLKIILDIKLEDNLKKIIDTTVIIIKDKQTDVAIKQLSGSVFIKLKQQQNYHIDINVFDVNKKTQYAQALFIDKQTIASRQNFLVTTPQQDVLFSSYYTPLQSIQLQSKRNTEHFFTIDYFKPNFVIAPPPFSLEPMPKFNYKPDSVFTVSATNGKIDLELPTKGFFHLKTNEQTKEGVTFFVYESSFPKIKNTEQMVLSTRYIMSKKEFDNCMASVDKKISIDHFWVELAGSNERAKELIKKYYGRVQEANKLFTSFQEGWKTDRGMIYIVFGAPSKVTTFKYGESWTYGEINNPSSVVFSFVKVINPFSDNDFYLERSEYFKISWYQAVDMWRQGRVYLDN